MIADVFDQAAHEAVDTEEPFIFMERLKAEWNAARVLLEELKADQVVQANKRRIPHSMKVGDQVMVDVQITERPLLNSLARGKLGVRRAGPFRITQQVTENSFRLALPLSAGRMHDVFHSSQLMPYHTQWQAEPAHQLDHPADLNPNSSSSTDVVEQWVSGPFSHARPVHVSVGSSDMAGSSEPEAQVPAVSPPSAELPSSVVVVPKPPARSRRLVPPTVIPRRIGTRAHPVADVTPLAPVPAEIVPIAVVSYPRQFSADSFDDNNNDSEDERPVKS